CKHVDLDNPLVGRSIYELKSDYYLINPKKHDRKSANTRNYYTYIIDNSKDWEEFPKRSKSLICSLYFNREISNGFVVIPIEDGNFGVSNVLDFWAAFDKLHSLNRNFDLPVFNLMLNQLYQVFFKNELDDDSAEIFFEQISKLTDIISKTSETDFKNLYFHVDNISYPQDVKLLFKYFKSNIDKGIDCRKSMEILFNPKDNNITHMKYSQLKNYIVGREVWFREEVWTDSECLLISKYAYKSIVEKMKNMNEKI
ncbi:hypothetical protein M0Q97_05155, partial [Candidatus Dojkabacteria bacterium]|nr:hypothetical protein [Candidatus Dojkabacteria bacterium]